MKAVLISIQPKWCELIASGKKTVEVRKTKPKIETPFKCYIYMTDNKEQVLHLLASSAKPGAGLVTVNVNLVYPLSFNACNARPFIIV